MPGRYQGISAAAQLEARSSEMSSPALRGAGFNEMEEATYCG